MKAKLLRRIIDIAHDHAHINSISWSWNAFRVTGWSASVGYRTDEDKVNYGNILSYGMDEKTFDRLVRQRYWELNKERYYLKYKKRRVIWLRHTNTKTLSTTYTIRKYRKTD